MECRKHKHQGNRGVCPFCLRDKLSLLHNTTPYYSLNRSVTSNSSTSTVSSSPSSPVKDHHRRAGSMSMSFSLIEAFDGGLKKSRSMAHVPTDSYTVTDSKKNKKTTTTTAKKTGFWTKLLHLKGKGGGADVGGLVTSRQRVY